MTDLNSVPLVDLHRHLDGNVRLTTMLDLAAQHGLPLPASTPEALRPLVQIGDQESDLMAFLERFEYLASVLVDGDACRRIAYENVMDAQNEQLAYVELRFSPWFMAERHALNVEEVVDAVIDGVAAGVAEADVQVRLIGILSRTFGADICHRELAALMRQREHLVAIDLAGDEAGFPAPLFETHFRKVRDAGLGVTIHAGEADGPQSVWSAINSLGATRIGHGVRSIEDPALMDYLIRNDIGLEVCLTSNVHTSTVANLASHPLTKLLDAGVMANINTDDPSISGIDLAHEYAIAAPGAGLSEEHIAQCRTNGPKMAFAFDQSSVVAT